MTEVVSQWDSEFIDVEQEMLFAIVLAANYLDQKQLLDLACAKVRCVHPAHPVLELENAFCGALHFFEFLFFFVFRLHP